MLAILLRQRARLFWNRLVRGPRAVWRVIGTLATAAVGLGFILVAGFNAGVIVERLDRAEPGLAGNAMALLLVAITLLTLLSGMGSAFHHLFLSGDLEVLLAAPVPGRALFWLKVAEIWRDSLNVLLFQAAALIGFGRALQLDWTYYVVATIVTIALTLAASAAGAILTLALARVRFGESLLGLTRILAVLLFLPIGVLGVPALGLGQRNRVSLLVDQRDVQQLAATLREIGPPPAWAPTTWAAHLLLGDDAAVPSLALLLITAAIAVTASHLIFDTLFQGGWERVRFSQPASAQKHRPLARRFSVSGPIAGLLQKDWRTLLRDPRWRANAFISLVALGLPALLLFAGDPFARAQHATRFWVGMLPVPYLAYLFGTQQGAATLAYEGRNLTLLRAAPVGMGRILVAKAAGGLVLVMVVTWLATVLLGIRHGGDAIEIAQALLAATWLALGATVAAVAGAALTMDIDGDNPQRRIGCLGAIVTSALSLFFFISNTALLMWWVSRTTLFGLPRQLLTLLPIVDIALPVLAVLSIGVLGAAWQAGARRLALAETI